MAVQDITGAVGFLGCYIQRFTSNFGINGTPTSVDLDLIPGHFNQGVDVSGTYTNGVTVTGFDFDNALPGRMSGFEFGAFKFVGIIESYTENYSESAGPIYNVKMSDPRIIFNDIPVILDGKNSISSGWIASGLKNYLDIYNFYDRNISADNDDVGITWEKVRTFLDSTGTEFTAWGNNLSLDFASGYMPSGYANEVGSGIPNWYRIPEAQSNLSAVIQKVSSDFNKDYYAFIDYDTWISSSSGDTQTVFIQDINRVNESGSNDIDNFIGNMRASGTLKSYRRGKELRQEPTNVVVKGSPRTYWQMPTDQQRFWGYAKYGIPLTTDKDSGSGIVLLDHLVSEDNSTINITSSVEVQGRVYLKTSGVTDIYPPNITVANLTFNITGYTCSDNCLRAALFSQESWESILHNENETFANEIGIDTPPFRTKTNYESYKSNLTSSGIPNLFINLFRAGYTRNRADVDEELISAVYEATREVASTYMGKQFMVQLFDSDWINTSSFQSSKLYPDLESEVADSSFANGGYGSQVYDEYGDLVNIFNHELMMLYNNPAFKDNKGKVKAFASILGYDSYGGMYTGDNDPYKLNTEVFDQRQMFVEQGNKLCIPINVTPVETYKASGIVEFPNVLEGQLYSSGYANLTEFREFLFALDYTEDDIVESGLMNYAGDNGQFGLAPPRLPYINTVGENYGIHIPIRDRIKAHGNWVATGTIQGGTKIVEDQSLEPSTFASYEAYLIAREQLAESSINTSHIIDSADITVAGLPEYNIGSSIGETSNITSISVQYGSDGLTTTYQIRTFALPQYRKTQLLENRINNIIFDQEANDRTIVRIGNGQRVDSETIRNSSQIREAVSRGRSDTFSRKIGYFQS